MKNPTGPQHDRENNESRQIGLAYKITRVYYILTSALRENNESRKIGLAYQNNSRLLYPNQCAARKE